MRLYAQIILIIGLTVLAVAAVLFLIFELTVMGSYVSLEQQYVTQDLNRAENAINGEVIRLSEIAQDWAVWDDTYAYVQNRNSRFEISNLAPLTLKGLNIAAIAFYDLNGSLISGLEYDPDSGQTTLLSDEYLSLFRAANLSVASAESHAGIIPGDGSPLIIASHPIFTSLMEGPARGNVVVAEPLDDAKTDLLSNDILRTISIVPISGDENRSTREDTASISLFSVGTSPGTRILSDISGKPVLLLKIDEPGDLMRSGLYSRVFLFISLILLTLLFMGLVSMLLNHIIIAPLQVLNRYLLNIGDSGSLSGRIDLDRDDEIGDLTSSINTMLASLEEAQRDRVTSEQRLSRLIDLVEEGICLIGPDDLIWFANPTLASIFETTTHDLTGRSITSILTPEAQNSRGNPDNSSLCMTSGQHEFHSRTHTGHDVWVRVATDPYPLDTGRMGHLCVITDITPFRTAERELLLSNKKLALLGSMTRHDIVNQLTTIRGMLGLIKRKNADRALDQLITSAEDASERINKHIEFSKEYQKAGIEKPRWQDIKTVWNLAYAMSRRRGLTFSVTGDTYEIYADQLLQKVFYNLIDNSIRHGKDVFYITISTKTENSDLLIIYEDDGGGVPDAMKNRIFERGVGTGTGWGLFFVYEVLNLTGMSISESGTFGIGVRFIIRIPEGIFRPVMADSLDQNGGVSSLHQEPRDLHRDSEDDPGDEQHNY